MLIKIIAFGRKEPQRPADLKRQLRYLFSPKLSRESPDKPYPGRLLGPPQMHRLVTSAMPWGKGVALAAEQLANQMYRYCRQTCVGKPMPHRFFVHIVFSFSPVAKGALAVPPDPHRTPPKALSISGNALRVTFDALNFLGYGRKQPGVFVVHGDRRHVHVHAVIALPVAGGESWDILTHSRKQIDQWALISSDTFELPISKGKTARQHQKRWQELA